MPKYFDIWNKEQKSDDEFKIMIKDINNGLNINLNLFLKINFLYFDKNNFYF